MQDSEYGRSDISNYFPGRDQYVQETRVALRQLYLQGGIVAVIDTANKMTQDVYEYRARGYDIVAPDVAPQCFVELLDELYPGPKRPLRRGQLPY